MSNIVKIGSGGAVSVSNFKTSLTSITQQTSAIVGNVPEASLQLALIFDITGSMFKYFKTVRSMISNLATEIKSAYASTEFAIGAYRNHGDEGRHGNIYYMSELCDQVDQVNKFADQIEAGGGGDGLSCMEECLRAANQLSWKNKSPKALVIFGDQPPHGVVDSLENCDSGINYKHEIDKLTSRGIKIYPVFYGSDNRIRTFYKSLAEVSGGRFLEQTEVEILAELLLAIALKISGQLQRVSKEWEAKGCLTESRKKALYLLEN